LGRLPLQKKKQQKTGQKNRKKQRPIQIDLQARASMATDF
jgi:hypothetical protein